MARAPWSVAGFDLMMLALAAVHAVVVRKLWQRARAPQVQRQSVLGGMRML